MSTSLLVLCDFFLKSVQVEMHIEGRESIFVKDLFDIRKGSALKSELKIRWKRVGSGIYWQNGMYFRIAIHCGMFRHGGFETEVVDVLFFMNENAYSQRETG